MEDEKPWEAKMKSFLKKTGEDFKRFGNDIKTDAQKLLEEVKDPEGQAKIREGLKTAAFWAKKTAEEVADVVVEGTRKAEEAFVKATDRAKDFANKPVEGAPKDGAQAEASPAPTPPSPPPEGMPAPPPEPAKKTVGKSAKPKKASAKKPSKAKKTIGKKKGAAGEA